MKRFISKVENLKNNQIILDESEHNHLKNVLRLKEGEEVIATLNDENDYICEVFSIKKNFSILKINKIIKNIYNPSKKITVYQGFLKKDNMSLIVQKLNELGVSTFVPFESENVVSMDKSGKIDKLQDVSNQSCKQCKRSIAMNILPAVKIKDICNQIPFFDIVIFANETEKNNDLQHLNLSKFNNVALIVGSEGGFSENEINLLIQSGAKSITLGKRILRAETASIVLSGITAYIMGEI